MIIENEFEISKKDWAEGPWHQEPDKEEFKYKGYTCQLLRNHLGTWCGYVWFPIKHPWAKKDYSDIPSNVHGGLTFSCQYYEDTYTIGFDCGHGGDLFPAINNNKNPIMNMLTNNISLLRKDGIGIYRDIKYARQQCKLLVREIEAAK